MLNISRWLNFIAITTSEKASYRTSRLGCELLEDRVVPAATPNENFVSQLYPDLFNRAASSSEMTFVTNQLANGVSRTQVANTLLETQEARNNTVNLIYQTDLHRAADQTGLSVWSEQLLSRSIEQIRGDILGSAEFFQRAGGTNDGFLTALYASVLNRTVDPSGATYFGQELSSGVSRTEVAEQVLNSEEFHRDVVEGIYQRFLKRSPEAAGLKLWVDQLALGSPDQVVIAKIVSSPEYQSLSQFGTVNVTAPATQSNPTGSTVNLQVSATDSKGNAPTFSATGLPPGLSISATTGLITGTIASTAVSGSPYTVTVTAKDGTFSDSATFTWNVTRPIGTVTVTAPATQSKNAGATVNLPVTATDTNGAILTFSATGLPPGLSIGATTGIITGTIASTAATGSPYTVTVTATDGTSSGHATFTWNVTAATGLAIVAPATQQNVNGAVVSGVTVSATGKTSDPITFTATNLPPGLTINSTTGVISGTIAATGSNNSPYAVAISVTQGGTTKSGTFTWVVTTSATSTLPFSLTDPKWVTLPSGVRIQDTTVGTGTAAAVGNTINVKYTGYLTDGTVFDSSNSFSTPLNLASLIAGWVDAIPGMKPGGTRLLDIPASLAYGSTARPGIPANSELVFSVTLNSAT